MFVAYSKYSAEIRESQRNFALRVYLFMIDYGKVYKLKFTLILYLNLNLITVRKEWKEKRYRILGRVSSPGTRSRAWYPPGIKWQNFNLKKWRDWPCDHATDKFQRKSAVCDGPARRVDPEKRRETIFAAGRARRFQRSPQVGPKIPFPCQMANSDLQLKC